MSYTITVKISGGIPPEVKLYGDVPVGTFTVELNEGKQQTRFIARHHADGRCISIAHDEYDRAERAQYEAELEAENRASWERFKAKLGTAEDAVDIPDADAAWDEPGASEPVLAWLAGDDARRYRNHWVALHPATGAFLGLADALADLRRWQAQDATVLFVDPEMHGEQVEAEMLPPEIEAVIEEGRRHPERRTPYRRRRAKVKLSDLRTAAEIHEQDMQDPEYRRAWRREQIRRWAVRQPWLSPLLWWCDGHDAYHIGPLGHAGQIYHD